MKIYQLDELHDAATLARVLEPLPLGGVVAVAGPAVELKRLAARWREAAIRRGFRLSIKADAKGVVITKHSGEPRYRRATSQQLGRKRAIIDALRRGLTLQAAARTYGISHQRVAAIAQEARVRLPRLNRQAIHEFVIPYLDHLGADHCVVCGTDGAVLRSSLCEACRQFLTMAREAKSAVRRYAKEPSDRNATTAASLLRRAGLSPQDLELL